MPQMVEIIRMKMREGVTEDEVLRASEQANELFRRMPGLRRRTLAGPDSEGRWTDTTEFEDEASVEQARDIAHEQPGGAADYFALVDMETLTWERLPLRTNMVLTTAPPA